jgi:putative transposase
MPRRRRFHSGGYVYHVLYRAVGRQRIFHTEQDYRAFENVLEEAWRHVPMRLLAYCILPNHWHLVLWPRGDGDLSEYMRWLTVTHAQRYHAAHESAGMGALYQGRFKSFPVQEDDHFYRVCRYVERNALRANLASRAELWRWSSLWQWWNASASVRLDAWPLARPTGWLDYVNRPETEAELAALRRAAERSSPYGDDAWRVRTAKDLGLESTLRSRGRPRNTPEW